MAQLSGFWTTTSSGAAGDQQAGYTQAHLASAFKIISACSAFEGVARYYLNELACTVTGANAVSVNTGGAMVDGHWYYNDAAIALDSNDLPSAVGEGNTVIHRIVLRCSWGTTFDTAITVITGTSEQNPSAPAITQTSGTTYDITLYQALVTTAGVVTLTDERVWATGGGLVYRQGGSATEWNTSGTTNYASGATIMQAGSVTTQAGSSVNSTIIFPVAFSGTPLLFVHWTATDALTSYDIGTIGDTGFAYTTTSGSPDGQGTFVWFAIGPA